MYEDKVYEQARKDAQIQTTKELEHDIKTVEMLINRLLTQLFECTASISERDFNVCAL